MLGTFKRYSLKLIKMMFAHIYFIFSFLVFHSYVGYTPIGSSHSDSVHCGSFHFHELNDAASTESTYQESTDPSYVSSWLRSITKNWEPSVNNNVETPSLVVKTGISTLFLVSSSLWRLSYTLTTSNDFILGKVPSCLAYLRS